MGAILSPHASLSTAAAVKTLYETGNVEEVAERFGPQWMVDVRDTARLHVAALVDPEVKGERILAFAHPFNWNDVLGCLRRIKSPERKEVPEDVVGLGRDLSRLDNGPGEELLRRFGRRGWTGLEESVRENVGL